MQELETIRTEGKDMIFNPAWGHLGRPPRDIMDGSASQDRQDLYFSHQKKLAAALATVNQRARAIKVAEVRAKYLRDFPSEE